MPQCAAFGCNSRTDKKKWYAESGATISFHKFPVNNPALVKQWVRNIGRSGFTPSRSSVLCSTHFSADCYEIDVYQQYGILSGQVETKRGRRLVDGTVPTLFSRAPHARRSRGAEADGQAQSTAAATDTVTATDDVDGDASSASGAASSLRLARAKHKPNGKKHDRQHQRCIEQLSVDWCMLALFYNYITCTGMFPVGDTSCRTLMAVCVSVCPPT